MRHKTILEVGNFSLSRKSKGKTVKLVRNMDFQLEQGGILGIVGESGSGKEFLSKALLGLLDRSDHVLSGKVLYLEKDILTMDERDLANIRGRGISLVPSCASKALNPHLKIGRQLDILQKRLGPDCSRESVNEVLSNLGIEDLDGIRKARVNEIGEETAYRTLLAMAAMSKPKILFAENPTDGFDGLKKKEIMVLLKKISIDYRISAIVTTDDFDTARFLCDRAAIMYKGLVVEEATVSQLMDGARHPYSAGLVESLESAMEDDRGECGIDGGEIRHLEAQRRCPFAERCGRRKMHCFKEMPKLSGEGMHKVRCFNPLGGAEL